MKVLGLLFSGPNKTVLDPIPLWQRNHGSAKWSARASPLVRMSIQRHELQVVLPYHRQVTHLCSQVISRAVVSEHLVSAFLTHLALPCRSGHQFDCSQKSCNRRYRRRLLAAVVIHTHSHSFRFSVLASNTHKPDLRKHICQPVNALRNHEQSCIATCLQKASRTVDSHSAWDLRDFLASKLFLSEVTGATSVSKRLPAQG